MMLEELRRDRVAGLVCVLSYLALCYCWFDHDLEPSFGFLPAAVPLLFFVLSLGAYLRWHGLPRPFADKRDNRLVLWLAGLAAASRLPFLAGAYGLFSSDAAVQGIMALHILAGKHHPIFLYRWSYIGSLKAHMTAFLAWLTGEPVLAFAGTAILMFGVFAGALFALARSVLPRRESVLAVAYVVAAPGFLTVWTMHNEGSYGDVLALGTLMLVLGARLLQEEDGRWRRAFWLGILGGLAFWVHILATYYLLAALAVLIAADWSHRILSRLGVFLGGFLLGYFPGLLWNASNEWLSFRWWGQDQTAIADRLSRALRQLVDLSSTSLAVLAGWWPSDHPPWPASFWRWLLLIVFPAAAIFFAVRFRSSLGALLRGRATPEAMVLGFALMVVAVFAQSSHGWLIDEPRYLLFLYSVVPIFIASTLSSLWRRSRIVCGVLSAMLLFVNLHGSGIYWYRAWQGDRVNRQFVGELENLGVRHGHTDYYVSYKYNFLSHGRLLLTSDLGPTRTEWYMPYREEADAAERVALIPRSYRFARRIGRRLDARGITYRREDLLYPVFFDLSEKVKPESLRPRRR